LNVCFLKSSSVFATIDWSFIPFQEFEVLLSKMESKYDWIKEDKHLFGQKGGPYDFVAPEEVSEKLAALETLRRGLEKRTNSNAQHVLAKVEEKVQKQNLTSHL